MKGKNNNINTILFSKKKDDEVQGNCSRNLNNHNSKNLLLISKLSTSIKNFHNSLNQMIFDLKNLSDTLNNQIIRTNYLLKKIKINNSSVDYYNQLLDRIGIIEDSKQLLDNSINIIVYKFQLFVNESSKNIITLTNLNYFETQNQYFHKINNSNNQNNFDCINNNLKKLNKKKFVSPDNNKVNSINQKLNSSLNKGRKKNSSVDTFQSYQTYKSNNTISQKSLNDSFSNKKSINENLNISNSNSAVDLSYKVILFLSLIKEMKEKYNTKNCANNEEFKKIKQKYEYLKKYINQYSNNIILNYKNGNNNLSNLNSNDDKIKELEELIKIKNSENMKLLTYKTKIENENLIKNQIINQKNDEIKKLKSQDNQYDMDKNSSDNLELIENLKKQILDKDIKLNEFINKNNIQNLEIVRLNFSFLNKKIKNISSVSNESFIIQGNKYNNKESQLIKENEELKNEIEKLKSNQNNIICHENENKIIPENYEEQIKEFKSEIDNLITENSILQKEYQIIKKEKTDLESKMKPKNEIDNNNNNDTNEQVKHLLLKIEEKDKTINKLSQKLSKYEKIDEKEEEWNFLRTSKEKEFDSSFISEE